MVWMLGLLATSYMDCSQALGKHHVGRVWLSRSPPPPLLYPWDILVKVVGAQIGGCRIEKKVAHYSGIFAGSSY